MRTRLVLATVPLALLSLAALPAAAAPKPISKTYTATAPVPDPTNTAGTGYSVCAQQVPQSFHVEQFKAPSAGTLKVTLPGDGYQGDWDLLLMDAKDRELANSGELPLTDELAQVKLKKPGVVKIVACNWAGGPTAKVSLTFTPAKK